MAPTTFTPTSSPMEADKLAPIAIVGIGCRFPDDATSPEKFWNMLMNKHSARREIPKDRFNVDAFYHPDPDRNGTMNNRGGHFLTEDIAAFDAPFFSISPAEAKAIDPMQRILLEVVYEAAENAGIPLSTLSGSDTGCYVGSFTTDYYQMINRDTEDLPKYSATGIRQAILSNRVSYFYNLKGPSITLDTACSSSLVAVHLACQSIRSGETKQAIVGATNAIFSPDIHVEMTNLHFLSPDSTCYTFDERANGYARGEGMAALILKPLEDALRDGDTIRAVIRGTAVNSDGKTAGITLPSKDAQISLIETAYKAAGVDPAVTGYFEAHGTGTPAGDPLETGAIGATLGQHRGEGEAGKLWIGSVKPNIGHLEGASGLAGLIKAVLSLEKGVIAPNIRFQKGNPAIDFDGWRIRVPTEATPWPVQGLRRASVNSFGYGGTNGHVIVDDAYHYMQQRGLRGKHCTNISSLPLLEVDSDADSSASGSAEGRESRYLTIPGSLSSSLSSPRLGLNSRDSSRQSSRSTSRTRSVSPARSSARSRSRAASRGRSSSTSYAAKNGTPRIFHVSANDEKQVKKLASIYAEHIQNREDDDDEFMADLAYTLCQRRSLLPFGASMVASTKSELVGKLEGISSVTRRSPSAPRLGFIFTGQGAQWFAMGRKLSQHPVFEETLLACGRVLRKLGADWSIFVELLKSERESRINEAAISQPLCTAVQIALVDLYADWGIHPSSVVGHSSGEIAAAYTTGALSLESAMCIAYWRGVLASDVKELAPPGGMMAAGLSEEDAKKELEQLGEDRGKIGIACINSPRSVTISGDAAVLTKLQRNLTTRGLFARKLQVDTAYHSHHMLTIADEYGDLLADIQVIPMAQRKPIQMFSSVTAQPVTENDLHSEYWVRNMVSCVRFSDALSKVCDPVTGGGATLLVELGPHSALAGPTKQILAEMPKSVVANIKYFSALIRGTDASISMLDVAAELFARGYPVDTTAAQCPLGGKENLSVLVDLPSYVWNHERTYWYESRLSKDYLQRQFARTDLLGAPFHDWNPIEPRWRNFIRLSEQPWVKSHVVQGAVLYPAAGFCCMALEAASQMSKMSGKWGQATDLKLREVSIARALVVPQTEEGVEVIFTMRPMANNSITSSDNWSEFRVFSCSGDRNWAEHCRGQVSVVYEKVGNGTLFLTGTSDATDDDFEGRDIMLESEEIYKYLDAAGLTYGPEFQGITDASVRNGKVSGSVCVTDTRSGMPKQFEHERILHPATLDALLQMCIVALSRGDLASLTHPYVPTFIEEVTVSRSIASEAGQNFEVTAEGRLHGFREAFATVSALQKHSSKPAVLMKNIKCMAIASGSGDSEGSVGVSKHCFTVDWQPDVEMLPKDKLNDLLRDPSQPKESRVKDLELVAYYYLDKALKEVEESEMAGMLPHHQKFFRYLLHQRDMVRTNTHEQQTDEWAKLEFVETAAKIKSLIEKYQDPADFEGRMFTRMGQSLPIVLRQEVEPLSVMLKDNLLYDYYSVSLGVQVTYPQVAKYVSMLSHKNPNLSYLEIGAGTGGLTVPVLGALSGHAKHKYPRFKSYTFTDISTGFFEQATEKFNDWADLMVFKKLDIEQDPESQGFVAGTYDVILAANVLHATFDMEKTIQHSRSLLKPGGKLIVLDMTHSLLSVSLIWGNLPGWWNCSESWREYGPLLNESQWEGVVQKHGFTGLDASTPDFLNPLEEGTRVMIATAVEDATDAKSSEQNTRKRAFIIEPFKQSSTGDDIVQESKLILDESGVSTEICSLAELEQLSTKDAIIVSFAEVEDAVISDIKPSTLALLQRIAQESAGLLWITRGGQDGSRPELSLFHGLARSIRSEHEDFRCITLDFTTNPVLQSKQTAKLIWDVYEKSFGDDNVDSIIDREYAEEGGVLRIKRAIEDSKLNHYIAARTKSTPLGDTYQDIWQSEQALKLKVKTLGSLDSFVFDRDPAMDEPVPDGQVEVDVRAVGLNFRDVLISMGEVSDNYLGNECAGIVTKLGKGVEHLSIGDRVAVWCVGCFGTRMRNPACCVQRIPDDMEFSTAAALPLIYVTAFYGLIHVARLNVGETVLIHAAAGGVGQAAVQLAKVVGAKVLVTVGTEEKKQHIMETYGIEEDCIFNSRDLTFVEGVQKATNGRGVDVVLNSLAGEALQATWRCIAPFGRFVEIGKRDIDSNGRLEMAPFSRNVTFTSVDVTVILRQNLRLAEEMFTSVMAMVKNGHITAPSPLTVEPFSKIEETFRTMQAGKHIGKIVLEPRAGDLVPVAPEPLKDAEFPSNASYLLAGGLGGLGRSVSRWMVARGARNLIYGSRSGASSTEAKKLIRELEAAGARCSIVNCSVTDVAALSRGLARALQNMPPIRGVIQGAMVLKDQMFANMSHETFMNTIRPKVQGSWALHEATSTLKQPLDFFVLLSSVASFVGNPGQSNYVAGCNYQGALAAHRHSLGLPATAIDIGKVANVGYVAENAGTVAEQNLVKMGLLDIQEDELLAMLEMAMRPAKEGVENGHLATGAHSTVNPSEATDTLFWSRDPVFSHMEYLRQHLTTSTRSTGGTAVVVQPLPTLLASAMDAQEANTSTLDALKRKLSRALMVPEAEMDANKSTSAYGMDSLISVEIRNWISREAKADVPVFEILQAASLTALAQEIVRRSALVKEEVKMNA